MDFFYVYIIQNQKKGHWYTGYTKDLKKRLLEHNKGLNFSTKNKGSWELIYYEASLEKKDAMAREKFLKSGMGKRYLKNRLKFFLKEI